MISALLPVRNGMPFVESAVLTALSCPDIAEVVVQDAGSDDGTPALLAKFEDTRVSVVSEADSGQADALNRALARASQPWLLWLNADDIVAPDALARLANRARSTRADVVYGDFELIRSDGSPIRTYRAPRTVDPRKVFATGAGIFSGSMLVRKEVLSRLGAFDPRLSYCMDYDLLLRLALAGPFAYVPGVVAALRMHPGSKSLTNPWGFLAEHRHVQQRYRSYFGVAVRARAQFADVHMAILLATTKLRFSRSYSAIRRRKQL